MTDRELKPCPFCGSEDVRFPESIGEPPYNACRLCGSMALIAKWNSRPIEDALRAEVERLKVAEGEAMLVVESQDASIAALKDERDECALGVMTASERAGRYANQIASLKAELAKYTEPLSDEQAVEVLRISLVPFVGPATLKVNDAAIRRVRRES